MTATEVRCPKCGGECWDEKGGKFWGNGIAKSGKPKPRWKCKRKGECDGAVWEKDSPAAAAGVTSAYVGNLPNDPAPDWLQGHHEEVQQHVQQIQRGADEATWLPSELAAKRGLRFINNVIVPALPPEQQNDPLVWSQLMRVLNGFIVSNEKFYGNRK